MSRYMYLSIYEDEQIGKVAAALDSEIRRKILRLIDEHSFSISEIAKRLDMPLSSTAFHVKNLQEAGLIRVQERPATRGMTKIVSRRIDEINLRCTIPTNISGTTITRLDIPVGSFVDCKAMPSCGMASAEKMIGLDDTPGIFYSTEKQEAQIIWLANGYLEYRIPNYYLMGTEPSELIFSMELCSELPNYRNEWPSDITFWINGHELCTWISPGDFGGRRGRLNPEWWPDISTQYGLLKTIHVNEWGVYLDEQKESTRKLSELHIEKGDYFTLRIGIKPDAENVGGINLFGEKFGDYEQAIAIRVEHTRKKEEKANGE